MPEEAIHELMQLTPMNYIGNAVQQTKNLRAAMDDVQKTL